MNLAPKYAYYPGCSGQSTSSEYEVSTRAVCRALGLELAEIPDWSCCGSTPAHTVDHVLSAALAARNLVLAKEAGFDTVVTPCPSCLTNLKTAVHRMEDPDFMDKVNKILDRPFQGGVQVKSVLQIIFEDIGPARLKAMVKKPLSGLRLAPYYGCIMNRPPDVMQFDDPENPISIDKLMEALGAEIAPFPLKVECCGASFGVARKDVVTHLSGKLLQMAEMVEAQAFVTACPLCQMNLDLRQGQVNMAAKTKHNLPVFYYTQLIGVALGLAETDLGLDKLIVSPRGILARIGQKQPAAANQ
jgi:heterodisulfide reductase subunit B